MSHNQGTISARSIDRRKAARKYQTWTIAAFLVSKTLLENPNHFVLISFDEVPNVTSCVF
ncbi:glycoside hydrolase 100 family protein [Chroococcidiopsis sp. SAG 2025]|uniref:glycoside hydrolase 100 family protein n=1 Tax=Chroococcidiopsis sp. SAG 2025 TaxID=171389 RepID=UPI002936ED28|nr:glycoside hydrolase 100 family protein [Chroococcidiopsis sp. SAG 2025]